MTEVRSSCLPDTRSSTEFDHKELFYSWHYASTIKGLAATLLVICISALSYYTWLEGRLSFSVPWLCLPILVIVLGLMKTGQAMAGARILHWGLVLAVLVGSYRVTGVSTPSIYLLPVLVMSAFLLLGRGEARVMFAVVTLSVSWQVYIQTHGWIPPISSRPPEYYFFTIVSVMMAALLLGNVAAKNLIFQFLKIRTMNQALMDSQAQLIKEVSDRKEAEALLKQSEERLRFVLEGAEQGFWDWDIASGTVERNKRWAEMLGYTYEEIKHTTQQWTDFIYPDDRERAWSSINDVLEGRAASHKAEYRMLHKDGSIRWILDQANVMQRDAHGKPTRMSGTHTDITERKLLEDELKRQAHLDYLTGLDNRRSFMEKSQVELSRTQRYDTALSVLMVDIDTFKNINDTYGHQVGDSVLKILAMRFQAVLRNVDIVGRLGGEEFGIVLPETDIKEAVEVAERLRVVISETVVALPAGLPIHFTISVGVAALTERNANIDMLLHEADKALYRAKQLGRNKVCT